MKIPTLKHPLDNFADFYKNNGKESGNDIALAGSIKKDLFSKLEKIKKHFHEFDPDSVQHMLAQYAHIRHRYTKGKEYYAGQAEKIQLEYRAEAEKRLLLIQTKKFFDIESKWRAGLMELKGIDTTFDFEPWRNNLHNCPFLSPITQNEVDLMLRFLNDTPVEMQLEDDILDYDYFNYPYLKQCYAEEEETELQEFYQTYSCVILFDRGIPPWYPYYDTFMGTNGLLALPDIKFPKELYYRHLFAKHKQDEEKKALKKAGKKLPPPFQLPERKPWIGLNYEEGESISGEEAMERLVDKFETEENKKLFENYSIVEILPSDEDEALKEETDRVIDRLWEAREPVPIEANEDWREGLIISYRKYKARKIIDAIPAAYEDYLMRLQTGLGYPPPEPMPGTVLIDGLYQYQHDAKKEILEGRKLSGEPEDFNY